MHHQQGELSRRAGGGPLDACRLLWPQVDLDDNLAGQGCVVLKLCNHPGLMSLNVYLEHIQGPVLVAKLLGDLVPGLEVGRGLAAHTPLQAHSSTPPARRPHSDAVSWLSCASKDEGTTARWQCGVSVGAAAGSVCPAPAVAQRQLATAHLVVVVAGRVLADTIIGAVKGVDLTPATNTHAREGVKQLSSARQPSWCLYLAARGLPIGLLSFIRLAAAVCPLVLAACRADSHCQAKPRQQRLLRAELPLHACWLVCSVPLLPGPCVLTL